MRIYQRNYSDLKSCLEDILRDKGKAVFRDGSQVAGMVRDLMPGKTSDWNMIRRMTENNILNAFVDADSGSKADQDRVIYAAINKLVNQESIEQQKAEYYVQMLAQVFGWETQKPEQKKRVSPVKKRPDYRPLIIFAAVMLIAILVNIGFGVVSSRSGNVKAEHFEPIAEREFLVDRPWSPGLLQTDEPVTYKMDHYDFEKYPVLGSGLLRQQVGTVTFLSSLEAMPKKAWDVSVHQDKQVMAWALPNDTGLYDLYIAAEGGVDGRYTFGGQFEGYCNLTSIQFNNSFRTERSFSMARMFAGCSSLRELDLSGFDTANVENMSSMFSECTSLTKLDLSGFDTSKVYNMGGMFSGCSNLTQLNLSSFNTANVEYMAGMFSGCEKLETLDLSGFNTSAVTNMGGMFQDCAALSQLNLSNFDTTSVTEMYNMFTGCERLSELNLSSFDTSKVTTMSTMFNGCELLAELDLSSFDTSSVTDMYCMFQGCEALTALNLSHFNTEQVTDMTAMFNNCPNLESLNLNGWKTDNITMMKRMFGYCSALKPLNLSKWDTSSVTDMSYMFTGWDDVNGLQLGKWETDSVTDYTDFMDEGMLYQKKPWEALFA